MTDKSVLPSCMAHIQSFHQLPTQAPDIFPWAIWEHHGRMLDTHTAWRYPLGSPAVTSDPEQISCTWVMTKCQSTQTVVIQWYNCHLAMNPREVMKPFLNLCFAQLPTFSSHFPSARKPARAYVVNKKPQKQTAGRVKLNANTQQLGEPRSHLRTGFCRASNSFTTNSLSNSCRAGCRIREKDTRLFKANESKILDTQKWHGMQWKIMSD